MQNKAFVVFKTPPDRLLRSMNTYYVFIGNTSTIIINEHFLLLYIQEYHESLWPLWAREAFQSKNNLDSEGFRWKEVLLGEFLTNENAKLREWAKKALQERDNNLLIL